MLCPSICNVSSFIHRKRSLWTAGFAAQQAEMNNLTKTLGDLEKMRVKNEDQTKHLDQIFSKSTGKLHKIYGLGAVHSGTVFHYNII